MQALLREIILTKELDWCSSVVKYALTLYFVRHIYIDNENRSSFAKVVINKRLCYGRGTMRRAYP